MPEGMDDAVVAFNKELAPRAPPVDRRGNPINETTKPEPMFSPRPIEGDPLTGDTRDGGDNVALRTREREVADGRQDSERDRVPDRQELRNAPGEGEHERADEEPEDIWAILAEGDDVPRTDERAQAEGDGRDAEGSRERDASAEKYEVTADGETFHITLEEALRGYSREQTFHKRLQHLNQYSTELGQSRDQLNQGWETWNQARLAYEEDVRAMLPAEPDWDREFAENPALAHGKQKVYQTIYGKLAASQQARAQREQQAQIERDRQVQDYAVKGFSKFVMDNKIPDEPTLKKNLQSMRRTAANAGFSEYEVATVYDPRMLTVLLKASKYDRMMAAKPRAVIPGKGRTLTPGAATPLGGNGQRRGLDEALRRQASSGSLDDTAQVFRRLL